MSRQAKLVHPAMMSFLLHSMRSLITLLKVPRKLMILPTHDTVVEAGYSISLDSGTHHLRNESQHYAN
jgi:hypothetical protein